MRIRTVIEHVMKMEGFYQSWRLSPRMVIRKRRTLLVGILKMHLHPFRRLSPRRIMRKKDKNSKRSKIW